jgi:hypothetical protein
MVNSPEIYAKIVFVFNLVRCYKIKAIKFLRKQRTMAKIYLMKRANGQIFTLLSRVAVWIGKDSLEISRARNRVLDIYQPVIIDDKLSQYIKNNFSTQGSCSLWVVEPQTNNADLTEGRLIDWTDLESLKNQPDPEPAKASAPKVRATIQEFQFS